MKRLAIVCSHPIQYYAPWFRELATCSTLEVKVFYLWDYGSRPHKDPEFGEVIEWDVDLLSGYNHEFVRNLSPMPGTNHFWGLINPSLRSAIRKFDAEACLIFGYNAYTLLSLVQQGLGDNVPLLFRGDSHLLGRAKPAGLKKRILSKLFEKYAALLYTGESNKAYFKHFQVPDQKLFFCPHSVNNDFFATASHDFDVREHFSIPASDTLFLFMGKFIEKKCPLELLSAFTTMSNQQSFLLFVGTGPLESELKQQAAHNPRVAFLPFQNQTALPDIYHQSDVVVLPSKGPYETWGLCINEAFCASTAAIVSSYVGCAADLVDGRDTGLIFTAGDTSALTQALDTAASNPEQLARWKQNALTLIDSYSYSQSTSGLLTALEQLSNSH